jgi:hypothetical protein
MGGLEATAELAPTTESANPDCSTQHEHDPDYQRPRWRTDGLKGQAGARIVSTSLWQTYRQ